MKSEPLLVYCTCPDGTVGREIATALLEKRLAACVNQLPGIDSLYRWQGAIERDQEVLLLIKTTARRLDDVEQTISELHPYELPEVIAVPLTAGSERYLQWIEESTD